MSSGIGVRLTRTEQDTKTAKLLQCLEQGGERLNDEAVGLKKVYFNRPLKG